MNTSSFAIRFVLLSLALLTLVSTTTFAQSPNWLSSLPEPRSYSQKRSSSYDRSGGNADFRPIAPSQTLTLLDDAGPATITHIWFTLADDEAYHLKKIVLRMYWDGETTPSVETPLGDFFGLGLGEYFTYQSAPLAVAPNKALNSFFPMPFQKHARITVTNMGRESVNAFYFNIDYQVYGKPLSADTLYFHAQYHQLAPAHGLASWTDNGDPAINNKKNLRGEDNFLWLEATGRGHFVGVTMSVLQNQDYWFGEGDDMFFIDGAPDPVITGTGTEDYFLGAYDFGGKPFAYQLFGAPVIVGDEKAGSRYSLYRFHLDSPVPFTKSFKASIEHGHANVRSDNYFSVAYWYQTEPHAAFPALPAVEDRLPRLHAVGGPGNAMK